MRNSQNRTTTNVVVKRAVILLVFASLFLYSKYLLPTAISDELFFVEKLLTGKETRIPHRLAFNYHTNLLKNPSSLKGENKILAMNVNHTIHAFKEAWNESEVEVAFLTDEDCVKLIQDVRPELLPAFQNETNGSHKSDICRVFDLYLYGGYYFDNDIFVVNVPMFPDHVSFSTVVEVTLQRFFQAFTATSPRHEILKAAIDLMVDFYVNKMDPATLGFAKFNMGTWTLREAHKRAVSKNPELADDIWFLNEVNLEDFPKQWFPEGFRDKHWRMYNFAVADLRSDKLMFRARLGIDVKEKMGWK